MRNIDKASITFKKICRAKKGKYIKKSIKNDNFKIKKNA